MKTMTRPSDLYLSLILSLLLGLLHSVRAESHVRRAQEDQIDPAALIPLLDDGIERLFGGSNVATAIPWYIFFEVTDTQTNTVYRCNGALVYADIAVTTASCIESGAPTTVRVGSLSPTAGGTVLTVVDTEIHPDYTVFTGAANIAVLKLSKPLNNTVALLNEDSLTPLAGTDVLFMAGLGKTGPTSYPSTLQGLYTFYVEDCYSRISFYNPIYHICTQAYPKAFGGCEGDLGAPVVLPGTRKLVALTSFASTGECGEDTFNGNTRISSYADWVQDEICSLSADPPSYCTADKGDGCGIFGFSRVRKVFSYFWGE